MKNFPVLFIRKCEMKMTIFSLYCSILMQVSLGMKFVGGESAALGRLNEYFWKKAREIYKCYLFINALETLHSVLLKVH